MFDRFDKSILSKQLYYFAWAVEIVAVMIGLALSVITAITYFDSAGVAEFADYMNAIVGTLPFIIVAIVELTKIPLSGAAFYASNWFWKGVFTFSLLFVALITFETMFNGLERFFVAQTSGVVEYKKELVNLNEKIDDTSEKQDRLKEVTIEKIEEEYNNRRIGISDDRDKAISRLEQQRREVKSDKDESLLQMRQELKELQDERKELKLDRANEISRIQEKYDAEIGTNLNEAKANKKLLEARLRLYGAELSALLSRRNKAYDDANIFTSAQAIKPFDEQIELLRQKINTVEVKISEINVLDLNSQISVRGSKKIRRVKGQYDSELDDIDAKIRRKRAQISEVIAVNQKDVDATVYRIEQEIERINKKFSFQEEQNLKERDNQIKQYRDYEQILVTINGELEKLEGDRTDIRREINSRVEGTQIYRIAMWWSGHESAADVEKDTVALVAFVWFGSLSAIVAFTGIILALASYAVTSKKKEKKSYGKMLYISMRRYFVHMRRRSRFPKVINKTVEVIKEVPVDKVVFVDKPIEVVHKKIVHIPMYTNDPELLGKVEGEVEAEFSIERNFNTSDESEKGSGLSK